MTTTTTVTNRVLDMLNDKKAKWEELLKENSCQDVTHKDFITNTILVFEWIISDVEKLTCHDLSQESL